MEKITLTIGEKNYQINREAVRLLVIMGTLTEVIPAKEPPVVIAPPKPAVVVPVPIDQTKPTKPVAVPESDFLGEEIEPDLFRMKGQDCNLLRAKGKLWPRSTETNRNPKGTVGVPLRFVLPAGWYWEIAESGDGAWAIVPYPTTQLGPDWLLKPATQPNVVATTTDQSGETNAEFSTTPQ